MSLKKLVIAAAAVLALGGIFANSAFAGSPLTDPASWTYTNTAGGVSVTPAEETIECSKTAASANFILHSKVLGLPVTLQATGVKCPGAKIKNVKAGTPAESMAVAEGKITFTGVSVVTPAECTTPATNETKALVADLVMDKTETAKSFVKFEPAAGAAGTFTSVKIENCAIAGSYPVKGVVYAEATNKTEVHAKVQEAVGNETTAAMSTLKLGEEAASLTGEIAVELAGANAGKEWGAEPK